VIQSVSILKQFVMKGTN